MATSDAHPSASVGGGVAWAALWGRGFRPFFLAAALYASVVLPFWIAVWGGVAPAAAWLWPAAWHAHEMLFGVVAAAIAGFLLTSVPVWTGRPALTGGRLAALFAVWLAGRLAMVGAGHLPDAGSRPSIWPSCPRSASASPRALIPSRQTHNLGFLGVLAALALQTRRHAAALGCCRRLAVAPLRRRSRDRAGRGDRRAHHAAPSRRTHCCGPASRAPVRPRAWADRLAVAAAAALAVADLLAPRSRASGAIACVAAFAVSRASRAGRRAVPFATRSSGRSTPA